MSTVAYFTQRHIKCVSRLPGRALQAAVAVGENTIAMAPSNIARINNRLRGVTVLFNEIREHVDHTVWLIEANFTDKHAFDFFKPRESHSLLAS